MRLVHVALSALAGVVLAGSSALAADYIAPPPPSAWGFYFGGGVCHDWADFDIDKNVYKKQRVRSEYPTKESASVSLVPIYQPTYEYVLNERKSKHFDARASSWCGTVQVGYDYQIDQLFLVGIFASYDWQKKSDDIVKLDRYDNPHVIGTAWLGNIATVGVRAGILPQPDLLIYALVGYSWTNGGIELYGKSLSGALSGPTIGAGVEKKFNKNISVRLEYRLTSFGSLSTGLSDRYNCGGYNKCKKETVVGITDQSVRLVASYYFN